jgi:hypothetical protein
MVVDEQDGGVALNPLTSNVAIERGKGKPRSGGRFLPALGGGVEITPYYPMGEAKAKRARGSLGGGGWVSNSWRHNCYPAERKVEVKN